MILFLSSSFLTRLRIQWKPDLKGFLIGSRNMFFFYPDLILESAEITPASINAYLASHGQEAWQLLGFFSPDEVPLLPGYAELNSRGVSDPGQWTAQVHLMENQGPVKKKLEIRMSGES